MFKKTFKYYKSKNPPPDLSEVLDFDNKEQVAGKTKKIELIDSNSNVSTNIFGLLPTKNWNAYELLDHPGLIFIKNPFTSIGQRYWTVKCLQEYSKRPHKNNLDALNLLSAEKEWWDACQAANNALLVNKMRWVTLGYHHNWDTKLYSEDSRSPFPSDLAQLSQFVTQALDFGNFNPEAAIINYYYMDSTLSGHTDRSEANLDAPLLSLSFGQTAVFLLGGQSLDDEPVTMLLRSGDVLLMSKESRLCYHGVPKILQIDSRFWDDFGGPEAGPKGADREVAHICQDEALWKPFGDYLGRARINVNVRQVLKRGQKRLCENEEKI